MLRRASLPKSRWLRAAPVPLWLVALGAVLATLACSCSNARGDRPNVIFIVTDDQAFSTLPHMPHLRRELSEAGVTLENFILNDPICCPSRVTILLGQYRHNHRLERGTPGGCAFRFFEDHEQQRAIGPVIQTAGYRTGIIGKYLNSYRKYLSQIATTEGIPKLPGWDDYHILASPSDYYDFFMDENGKLVAYTQKTGNTGKTGKTGKWPVYQTDLLTRLARNFIETSADEGSPFFLYLATRTPHEPATPARRHLRSARGLKAPRGPAFNQADVSSQPSLRKAPRLRPRQIAAIDERFRRHVEALRAVDELVRDVVQALRDTNELENTFIFYTSDNGYHFGEHRIAGGKATPFEESIRFPLIVRGPGVPAGVSREELVSNVDLLPTFLDLIGNAPDPMVDGRSLLPLLAADPPREPWRQSLVIESVSANRNHGVPPFEGIRTSRYKLVSYRDGERELYDLAVDPAEKINVLATTEPSVVAELEDRLAALFECKGATCRSLEDRPFETH